MNISNRMDIVELACVMGGATDDEAYEMRSLLCRSAYNGLTTYHVPDDHWRRMCDEAVELAAQ